jgi:hypothetical protein
MYLLRDMSHDEDKSPPAALAKALRDRGLRLLKNGLWSGFGERWFLAAVTAPQSWERMLSPLLSQAILEARQGAQASKAKPLAAVWAHHLSAAMRERLASFVARVAPEQAWAAGDDGGRFSMRLPGRAPMEVYSPPSPAAMARLPPRIGLFTDLHQWMLKVLLAPRFEERLLQAPRGRVIRNARTLAEVAQVSVPAAARFVQALDQAGHLSRVSGGLEVVEAPALLDKWKGSVSTSFRAEVGALFVRGRPDEHGLHFLLQIARNFEPGQGWGVALGLFSACQALELGHVRGAPAHLYVSDLSPQRLEELGLVLSAEGERVDIVLRVPRSPESLFRAAPQIHGARAADVLQCWLDVSHHRARGQEQAEFLWRRVIGPALKAP